MGIGVSWQADALFLPDTKKYELENPKTPFDNDQFIDYHIKLLTDRPLICYIEDPLASSERAAWKKLIVKSIPCRQKLGIVRTSSMSRLEPDQESS